jgi:methylated-DNA-protein-cysteine methyltransferase-like protein
MLKPNVDFRNRVQSLVAQIPRGRVMTYGQIAALCGVAHFGDPDLPWQRVVHKDGSLATGFPGGVEGHRQVLEGEGIEVSKDLKVDIEILIWQPALY